MSSPACLPLLTRTPMGTKFGSPPIGTRLGFAVGPMGPLGSIGREERFTAASP